MKYFYWLKEKLLARPRTMKHGEGRIIFKNIPSNEVDILKAKLVNEGDSTEDAEEELLDMSTLTNTALSTYLHDKVWHVAVVKYNPETKEAVVVETNKCGDTKMFATEVFKKLVIKYNLI